MRLMYKGVDITDQVVINRARYYDYAGGQADRLEIALTDDDAQWGRWGVQGGDEIQLSDGQLDTGVMYVDNYAFVRGGCELGAVSIPPGIREPHTRTWEHVRLYDLLSDCAERHGLALEVHGLDNYLYERRSQRDTADFAWLNLLCRQEGAALKIDNGRLIAYSVDYAMDRPPVMPVDLEDGPYRLHIRPYARYRGCTVESFANGSCYIPGGTGPVLSIPGPFMPLILAQTIGEADRIAKNMLDEVNRGADTLQISRPYTPAIMAGATVEISPVRVTGTDGIWYVTYAMHDKVADLTAATLCRRGTP